MFSLLSWTRNLRICTWETPAFSGSKKTSFPPTVQPSKHSPSYSDPPSINPMLRIALKKYLWIFLGTNLWDIVYGHLPNRAKLINPMFTFSVSAGHWTMSNFSFFRDCLGILYPIIALSEIIVALLLSKGQQRLTWGRECCVGSWPLCPQCDS